MPTEPLVVVGVGQDGAAGLAPEARTHIERADVLAGSKRQLALFAEFKGQRLLLEGNPETWVNILRARAPKLRTVVLATGDPLFYGIGRLLLAAFPREEMLFFPSISSVALAFARIKETWNDASIVSLHGRPLETLVPTLRRGDAKVAIFTDASSHPAAIARVLCQEGVGDLYDLWVCENLGSDQERVTQWQPSRMKDEEFARLNVVVLLAKAAVPHANPPLLGIADSAILHRGAPGGLITKRAIRLHALADLELHAEDVFWDVGAGSGSVSLEAARLSPDLSVFAIEKADDALAIIHQNIDRFRISNMRVIAGEAPQCLAGLPDPDAVFIGGSGGRLLAILERVLDRLKPGGRLVLSCIALETFTQAWTWLSERGLQPEAASLQLAYSRPLGKLHCLEPEHPIFLLRVKLP